MVHLLMHVKLQDIQHMQDNQLLPEYWSLPSTLVVKDADDY